MELHNLAYITFEELTFLTAQANKPFTYNDQCFRSVNFAKSLIAKNEMHNNVEHIQRQGIELKATNLERTIINILDRPDLAGGGKKSGVRWIMEFILIQQNF